MSDSPVIEVSEISGATSYGDLLPGSLNDFRLQPGEIGVILGSRLSHPLFRLLLGFGELKTGQISLFGEDPLAMGKHYAWRRFIGYAFREKGMLSNLSIIDNVALPARYHLSGEREAAPLKLAIAALREMGIAKDLWHQRPSLVDHSVVKKGLIARASVLSPKLYLLDDPTVSLRWPMIPDLLAWIRRRADEGCGLLISTDDYAFGLAIADWLILENGKIIKDDFAEDVPKAWLDGAEVYKSGEVNYAG